MCTVSFVGDHFKKKWDDWQPQIYPSTGIPPFLPVSSPSQEDFDRLKEEVADLRRALEAAKLIDAVTGQPDCEMEDKMEFLRKVAELVGIDLDDIIEQKV